MSETRTVPPAAGRGKGLGLAAVQTAAYYALVFAIGLVAASLGPTLPGLAGNTGASLSQISILFSARSLGGLIGALAGGRLYDRVRGHPFLAALLIGMALMLALAPVVSLLWALAGVILLVGVAEGTIDVGVNTLLVWVHRRKVAPYMNGLHFVFGVGAFLAPLVVARAILVTGDIQWAYWALAAAFLPVSLWVLRLPSPQAPQRAESGPQGSAKPLLVALLWLFFFLYVGAEIGFAGWIFTYAQALGLGGPAEAAYLTSGFWGAFTLGRLAGIPLGARVRPRWILLVDLLGALAGLALMLARPTSPIALWAGTLAVGLFLASIFPTTVTLADRRVGLTGRMTGWIFSGAASGATILPWLMGQFIDLRGPGSLLWALTVILILALGVLGVLQLVDGRR